MATTNVVLQLYRGGWREQAATVITDNLRIEGLLGSGAIELEDEAVRVATRQLALYAAPTEAETLGVEPVDISDTPWLSHIPGNSITLDAEEELVESLSFTRDENGHMDYAAELRAHVDTPEERLALTAKKMTNGTLGGVSRPAQPTAFTPLATRLNEPGAGGRDPRLDPGLDPLITMLGDTWLPGDIPGMWWSGNTAHLWLIPGEDEPLRTGYQATASGDMDFSNFSNVASLAEGDAFGFEAFHDVAAYGWDADDYAEGNLFALVRSGDHQSWTGLYGFTSTDVTPGNFTVSEAYYELAAFADDTGQWSYLLLRQSTDGGVDGLHGSTEGLLYMTQIDDAPDTWELRWAWPDDTEMVIGTSSGPPSTLDPRLGADLDNVINPTLFTTTALLATGGTALSMYQPTNTTGLEAISGDPTVDPYGAVWLTAEENSGLPSARFDVISDMNDGSAGTIELRANINGNNDIDVLAEWLDGSSAETIIRTTNPGFDQPFGTFDQYMENSLGDWSEAGGTTDSTNGVQWFWDHQAGDVYADASARARASGFPSASFEAFIEDAASGDDGFIQITARNPVDGVTFMSAEQNGGATNGFVSLNALADGTDGRAWLELSPSSDDPVTSGWQVYVVDIGAGSYETRIQYPDGTINVIDSI